MGRNLFGIMQGRLSPRPAHRIQAFPHGIWMHEFSLAKQLDFDFIEWLYEAERVEENPLSTPHGRAEICKQIQDSGTFVGSVCADYFMLHKLAGGSAFDVDDNVRKMRELIRYTAEIGASRILLPLLETSAVETPELKQQVVESLQRCTSALDSYDIVLGLEMEVKGSDYRALIERVGHPRVRAYYDAGNSTAQGFDIAEDVKQLLPVLEAVHIKDRIPGGTTRELGSGATNFYGFFRTLSQARFAGDFVFQHYFDSEPAATAERALAFITQKISEAREEAA